MEFVSLQDRISNVAKMDPQKIAIEYNDRKITYMELEERSNRIANFLHSHLREKKNVVVLMDRGEKLIESILGILKVGGIFVPVDPNYPVSRIKTMIEEVDAEWIISEGSLYGNIFNEVDINEKIKILDLDCFIDISNKSNIFMLTEKDENCINFQCQVSKNCYIYFTSGSTGKPKGILGRHKSLAHFIQWEIKEFGVDGDFRISQFTSPSFDPYLRDVFVPLCAGATLCIPEKETILNTKKLIEWIDDKQISLIHMVPSLYKLMINKIDDRRYFSNLKFILLAGEMLRGNDVRKFYKIFGDDIQLVNLYGPSETTLAKLFYRVSQNDVDKVRIPVGKPIDSVDVMILDQNKKKCQIGSIGEIYIRTPFISSGYYNSKELTKKVFLVNPFNNNQSDIIYKTGDLGIQLPDGNIEIVGRCDQQVKINGIRIEVGEIENSLLKHEKIKEAVVLDKDNETGSKYLCGYIVTDSNLTVAELREYLLKELPVHMVPLFFFIVERIPLSSNGKIDRKALIKLSKSMDEGQEYVMPCDELEEELCLLWEKLLDKNRVGVKDSFFEIGGNSMLLIKMHSMIEEKYPGLVKVTDIFVNPTIYQLAEFIRKSKEDMVNAITLKAFSLPEAYFSDENREYGTATIKFNIDQTLTNKLEKIAIQEGVDIFITLLGIYIFVLSNAAKNKEITIQTMIAFENEITEINLDLSVIEDISSLFEEVSSKLLANERKAYAVNDINKLKVDKKNKDIVIMFLKKDLYAQNQLEITVGMYDFILNVCKENGIIKFECNYNTERLRAENIDKLIKLYVNTLTQLTDKW